MCSGAYSSKSALPSHRIRRDRVYATHPLRAATSEVLDPPHELLRRGALIAPAVEAELAGFPTPAVRLLPTTVDVQPSDGRDSALTPDCFPAPLALSSVGDSPMSPRHSPQHRPDPSSLPEPLHAGWVCPR
jgi:hypothetical protein